MADSRYAALLHYKGHVWKIKKKAILFVAIVLLSLLITFLLTDESFSDSTTYVLFLFCLSVGLWVTEAIPPYAVGILIIGFIVWTLGSEYINSEPLDVLKYVNTWSSPVIWLMLGGFFIAEGMKKTQMDKSLFLLSTRIFGAKPDYFTLGMMLTTMIASMIMSNTATTAMMIAAVLPMVNHNEEGNSMKKRLLLGIPTAAALGGMGTIIGSPPNAIAVGALSAVGIEVNFLEWMLYGFPLAVLFTFIAWICLVALYPIPKDEIIYFDHIVSSNGHVEKDDRNLVIITLLLTVGLWITQPLHHISASVVASIPIVLLTISGVIKQETVRQLPWDTLMLVAGGLALGMALIDTGLAEKAIQQIDTKSLPLVATFLVFAYATAVFSNIMSNTATASIFIPIAGVMLVGNELWIMIIIGLSASTALVLPVSTPPNAIAFSTGLLKQSDFYKLGIFFMLLGPLCIYGWIRMIAFLGW